MRITPPYGYRELTPLLKTHRVVPVASRNLPAFALATNALPVTMAEIPVAGHYYPIVFSAGSAPNLFNPVAILGMSGAENLFVKDGSWAAGAYVPAYVRRYPFCMTRVAMDEVSQEQRIVCVEADQLREDGEALFDMTGQPLPVWTETDQLLQEFEADLDRTAEMCSILADYKLLEPFTMQANFKVGGSFSLDGMFRIDEKRIELLSAGELKNLIKKGILGRIYQHLGSLTNFNRLTDLKGLALQASTPAPVASAAAETAPDSTPA